MRRAIGMRRPRRARPRAVLLVGSLVLALGGVAHAVCPPQFLFGCRISGAAAEPGLTVENTTGDGLFARSTSGAAVSGGSTSGSGVSGGSFSGYGVHGLSSFNAAVRGESIGDDAIGVYGTAFRASGVQGRSSEGPGVQDSSSFGPGVVGVGGGIGGAGAGVGVYGESFQNDGVQGVAHNNIRAGVSGYHPSGGYGIYGESASGLAGYFAGNVHVNGRLVKAAGAFTIDHPLDPANKTLSHSFVESPDMLNIYNGTTLTDAHGEATVTLPAYFQALNREFRYQLTVIEQFAQAIVARKIQENQFMIKTDKPHVEVSWMVTGVRQDAYANAHRIVVEDEKPAHERGAYLYPEVYGQPKKTRLSQAQPGGEMQPMHAEAAPHHAAAQP